MRCFEIRKKHLKTYFQTLVTDIKQHRSAAQAYNQPCMAPL